MFTLAVFIGIYSYVLMGLGLAGLMTAEWIGGVTAVFGLGPLVWRKAVKLNVKWTWWWAMIVVQALVNLVGTMGPELGFDALWYHLTIPRIWLLEHKIFFMAKGPFYYSVMGKLVEMLYAAGLAMGSEILAKAVHWGFGLLATAVTYKLARKFLDSKWSTFAAVIFYSNLVVAWQSITAYVDLGRTFFEVLALYLMLDKKIYRSAIVLGLAISTKLLAFGSLPIFVVLLVLQKEKIKIIFLYLLITAAVCAPWLIFAFLKTGNSVYPIFSGYDLASVKSIWDIITIWFRSADPISPIYAMIFPLAVVYRKKLPVALIVYCLMAIGVWWFTPRTGGGRFLLPYLPVFSVVAAVVIKQIDNKTIQKFFVGSVVVVGMVTIGYRAVANAKYWPEIIGRQTRQDFLDKNLDKNFGNNFFYLPDEKLKELYR